MQFAKEATIEVNDEPLGLALLLYILPNWHAFRESYL
jgi:hypothetical protein